MKRISMAAMLIASGCKTPSSSGVRDTGGESDVFAEGQVTTKPTANGSCDTGYVKVPKNPEVGVSEDFCVMKYEAKIFNTGAVKDEKERLVEDGKALRGKKSEVLLFFKADSRASGTPWVYIDRDQAKEACRRAGAELISNAQWQAVARNIEGVASNWSGEQVGSGSLNRGHSDGTPGTALAATNEGDPCYQTGQSNCSDHKSSEFSQKRTHSLNNGDENNEIWDLAGNVWEWAMKDDYKTKQGKRRYVSQEPWADASGKLKWGPKGDYNNKSPREYGGLGFAWLDGDAGAVLRGGVWGNGSDAGVFSADLTGGPSASGGFHFGFRCVHPLH